MIKENDDEVEYLKVVSEKTNIIKPNKKVNLDWVLYL